MDWLVVLLVVITQPMLFLVGSVLATLFLKKNIIITSCVLFVPLPLLCWLLDVPGMLVTYSVALPRLVGITHYLTVRLVSDTSTAQSVCTWQVELTGVALPEYR